MCCSPVHLLGSNCCIALLGLFHECAVIGRWGTIFWQQCWPCPAAAAALPYTAPTPTHMHPFPTTPCSPWGGPCHTRLYTCLRSTAPLQHKALTWRARPLPPPPPPHWLEPQS